MKRLERLISEIDCPPFIFAFLFDRHRPYLQLWCNDTCAITGELHTWKGRKWPLSRHMTDSEVIQTCFLAAKVATEHELREHFKWNDQPIFRPHFDISDLHALSVANTIDARS